MRIQFFLALASLSFVGFSSSASAANIQGRPCTSIVQRTVLEEALKSLSPEERLVASPTIVSMEPKSTLESMPPIDVYEIVVETGVPGWIKYSVAIRMSQNKCEIFDLQEIESE